MNWGTGWLCRSTSPVEVVLGGWSGWVGVVDSRLSSGFDMTGFYWEMGCVHQRRVKPPGRTIYGGFGGGGQFGTG